MRCFWPTVMALIVGALAWPLPAMAGDVSSVKVKTFQFQPTPIEVKVGTQVIWTNADDIQHTVTSGTPENRDGRFESRLAAKDATFSHTFAESGTYTYFCDRHQSMRGEVRVK